jgi:hypothetical protein
MPNDPRLQLRESYPLWTAELVRFGDTDRLGHVNNAKYATYLETARVELMQRLHVDVLDLDRQQVYPLAEVVYGIVIGERALLELRGKLATGGDRGRVEHRGVDIKIDAGLDQHAPQLAAAENA